jgi:two-component system response regulator ChvI
MHEPILTLERPSPFIRNVRQITAKELRQGRAEIAHTEAVCVVDDDPSVRKSVSRLLESDGFSVRAFSEPEAFLNHIATNSVALAVLDIWMERMTGMELLAHLCARSPQTRVIFITGHKDTAARVTVMQAGAFAFFIKPFDDKSVFERGASCARRFHSREKKIAPPTIHPRGTQGSFLRPVSTRD